jgi:hypothetical protein
VAGEWGRVYSWKKIGQSNLWAPFQRKLECNTAQHGILQRYELRSISVSRFSLLTVTLTPSAPLQQKTLWFKRNASSSEVLVHDNKGLHVRTEHLPVEAMCLCFSQDGSLYVGSGQDYFAKLDCSLSIVWKVSYTDGLYEVVYSLLNITDCSSPLLSTADSYTHTHTHTHTHAHTHTHVTHTHLTHTHGQDLVREGLPPSAPMPSPTATEFLLPSIQALFLSLTETQEKSCGLLLSNRNLTWP